MVFARFDVQRSLLAARQQHQGPAAAALAGEGDGRGPRDGAPAALPSPRSLPLLMRVALPPSPAAGPPLCAAERQRQHHCFHHAALLCQGAPAALLLFLAGSCWCWFAWRGLEWCGCRVVEGAARACPATRRPAAAGRWRPCGSLPPRTGAAAAGLQQPGNLHEASVRLRCSCCRVRPPPPSCWLQAGAQPLIVRGPGAGAEVTAGGVFSDLLRLAAYLGAPS